MQKSSNVLYSKIRRFAAMYIDLQIAGFIGFFVFSPITDLITADLNLFNPLEFYLSGFVRIFPIMIVFSFKDFAYGNVSFGKHLLNLEVVSTNNKGLSHFKLFFRNFLFSFMWPIESILILLCNKRLGDYIFKTSVVEISEPGNS